MTDSLHGRMTAVLMTAKHARNCGGSTGRFDWPGPHADGTAWVQKGQAVWMKATSCGCGARVYAVAPEPRNDAVTHVFAADRYQSLASAYARAVAS